MDEVRFGRARRWTVVVALLAILAALPTAVALIPASGSTVSAAALLARVQASAGVNYSGYAESSGSLALPVTTGQLGSVSDLLGDTTQLRIWWRGDQDWRVDQISATGERDVHAAGADIWTWDYESGDVTLERAATTVSARLPRADDVVPAALARRLLSQATSEEVERLASQRVAGHEAAGLRYVPSAPQSTIARIDVWAMPGSGLPVSVDVYAKADPTAVLSTRLLDLDLASPSPSTTAFDAPLGAPLVSGPATDIIALAANVDSRLAPTRAGGLSRDSISPVGSGVAVYGEGVTVLVAIPIFGRTGDRLRAQLTTAVGSTSAASGVTTSIGVVNLLLTNRVNTSTYPRGLSWLLVGTVSPQTLQQAQSDFAAKGL
jgi:hypothetical protein